MPELDEVVIARKFGLRALVYPVPEQVESLIAFLANAVETGRCGAVPKMAVVEMLDYLQGAVNRQYVTKSEEMSLAEFEILRAPYYAATRVVSNVTRGRQQTSVTLNRFTDLLGSLIDPDCPWMRAASIHEGIREVMKVLAEFTNELSDQRKRDA